MRLLPVLLLAVAAAAEISIKPCVEWCVVDADLVVRGRLTAVNPLRREGTSIYETAVFRIEETFKGPALETVRFELARDASQPWVVKKRPVKVEVLCFLKRKGEGWELRRDEVDSLVRLDKALLYDAGSKDYYGRNPALAAVRRAVAIMPAKAKLRSLIVKHPVVPHPEAILNTQYLEVPIDRHLEARAHRLIAMKDHKARLKGVMILRHFKSDGNVKLLKALLASDAAARKIESPSRDAVLEHRTWRVYWMRAEAWRILDAWGVKAVRPVLLEPVGG